MSGLLGDVFQGFGSGLGGSIIDTAGNYLLAQDAWNKSVEMWDKTNAYNSPKAQMARFKEAGLNPNLIYGQMGSTTASPIEYKRSDFSSVLGNAIKSQQVKNMDAQNKNLAVQNALIMQQTRESEERQKNIAADTALKHYDNSVIMSSGYTSRDPWFLRFGGRFGDWLSLKAFKDVNTADWKPTDLEKEQMKAQGFVEVDGKWLRRKDVDYRWDGGLNIIKGDE